MVQLTPTHADLGIEIGKAQAMAEAAQITAERMEVNLNDRMDRIDKSMANGFKEIKDLIQGIHSDITDLKIESGKQGAKEETKKQSWSVNVSIVALFISFISIFADPIKNLFTGSH